MKARIAAAALWLLFGVLVVVGSAVVNEWNMHRQRMKRRAGESEERGNG